MKSTRALFVFGLVMGTLMLVGCPPSKPPPVHPDASDAATPVRHVDCATACKAYANVCASSDFDTCSVICGSIVPNLPGYADCLARAAGCDDGTACDHLADSGKPKKPIVNGH